MEWSGAAQSPLGCAAPERDAQTSRAALPVQSPALHLGCIERSCKPQGTAWRGDQLESQGDILLEYAFLFCGWLVVSLPLAKLHPGGERPARGGKNKGL